MRWQFNRERVWPTLNIKTNGRYASIEIYSVMCSGYMQHIQQQKQREPPERR